MNVWRLIAHHKDRNRALAWTRMNGRIAIGWNRVGDVRDYSSEEEIKAAIRARYPRPEFNNNAHLGAPSLWDLCHTMKEGDLVIIGRGTPQALVVQVEGSYTFAGDPSPTEEMYQHQRNASLTPFAPDKIWMAAGESPGTPRFQTLVQCAKPLDLDALSMLET